MDWDSPVTLPTSPPWWSSPAAPTPDSVLPTLDEREAISDFDAFRDSLNRHYYPAKVDPKDARPRLRNPRIGAIHLSKITLGYVRFGTAASVDPGDLGTYHVNVPVQGTVVSACGNQTILASPRTAAVFGPGQATRLPDWSPDAAQLCIKLNRAAVEWELEGLLGHVPVTPVEFVLPLPLHTSAGRTWTATLRALMSFIDTRAQGPAAESHADLLQRSVISALLLAQPHRYAEELHDALRPAPPGAVRRVVDLIEENPARPLTLADLAREAGVSARQLQYAFADHLGTTPTGYLRAQRLDRARQDLRAGLGSVSDIAHFWGFTNLGRFARDYHRRFGEKPSETAQP